MFPYIKISGSYSTDTFKTRPNIQS